MKEFMLFQVGHLRFCLELTFIKSVYRISDISGTLENKGNKDYLICMLDASKMPLYDFSIIFDIKKSFYDPEFQKVIRIEFDNNIMALRVDHVDGVAEIKEDLIVPLPSVVKGKTLKWFPQILKFEGELVPVLDPRGMTGKEFETDIRNNLNSKLDSLFLDMINHEYLVNIFFTSLKYALEKILNKELNKINSLLR